MYQNYTIETKCLFIDNPKITILLLFMHEQEISLIPPIIQEALCEILKLEQVPKRQLQMLVEGAQGEVDVVLPRVVEVETGLDIGDVRAYEQTGELLMLIQK